MTAADYREAAARIERQGHPTEPRLKPLMAILYGNAAYLAEQDEREMVEELEVVNAV